MSGSPNYEIVEGYIDEVKTYIPLLTEGIESLKKNPNQMDVIEEVHRLVHTIKGASAMVGIYGLSNIAFQMEDTLDEIIDGKIKFGDQAYRVMMQTVKCFQKYCSDYLTKGVDARKMLRDAVIAYRRIRGLPKDQDESVIQSLTESVPAQEGGAPDDDPEYETTEKVTIPDIPPELLNSFFDETQEHLEHLGNALSILESQIVAPGKMTNDQRECIRQIRRSVHTMKGAAAVVGFKDFSAWAHKLEDFLDWLYEAAEDLDPDIVAVLGDASGMLEKAISDPSKVFTEKAKQIVKRYTGMMNDKAAESVLGPEEADIDEDEEALDALLGSIPEYESEFDEETGESVDFDDLGLEDVELEDDDTVEEAEEEFEPPPDLPPELLESFYEEAQEHLDDLARSLNTLESQVVKPAEINSAQRELIRQIRRSVHTLKGAAAVIGLSHISTWAHSVEDLLDWLYESGQKIDPDIINTLLTSSDLLERIVSNPKAAEKTKMKSLQSKFQEIMGKESDGETESEEPEQPDQAKPKKKPKPKIVEPEEDIPEPEPDSFADDIPGETMPLRQTRTLRVDMERVDDLVNLGGELLIALSAFDQKMDFLMDAIKELELSRERLREIARDMEVGYEVKALERLGKRAVASQEGVHSPEEFTDFDSLELDRYSELSLIIRSLNESAIDVGAIHTQLMNLFSDFDGHLTRQKVILSELQDKMMRVRMTPMSTITNRLRQTVRDIANKLGKKIRLVIDGSDIELDRMVWDKITDPLMHILRNAADHGIEPPALRQAMEKPPVATIRLAASREGNQVVIRVSDDGAGLNFDAIRRTARSAGWSEKVETMGEEELTNLIFQPGFSTRGKISEVSGRGVGMDVVKENIRDLKGAIKVETWKNKGTQFTIRIPLTLAAVRALLFSAAGQTFAIALNEINEIIRIDPSNITTQPEDTVKIGNEILPLYYLARLLKIRGVDDEPFSAYTNPVVLVVKSGGKKGALVVNSLVGQREIVIKSTGSHLRYVKGISGATIMGDGSVVPILNIEELLGVETIVSEPIISDQEALIETPKEIMVVDDSVSIRQVVSRLMEDQGWKTQTAKDGIDALEKLREARPDLIVLDIEMPRMNGYEFLSALKAEPSYRNIPVIMLTSRTAAKHRDKALGLGAKGFIVKPYNDDEFIQLVINLTERSQQTA